MRRAALLLCGGERSRRVGLYCRDKELSQLAPRTERPRKWAGDRARPIGRKPARNPLHSLIGISNLARMVGLVEDARKCRERRSNIHTCPHGALSQFPQNAGKYLRRGGTVG